MDDTFLSGFIPLGIKIPGSYDDRKVVQGSDIGVSRWLLQKA
jgi:hypothetical protein